MKGYYQGCGYVAAYLAYLRFKDFFMKIDIITQEGKSNACIAICIWFLFMFFLGLVCIGLEV